jgi:chitin disaccharide deacetylase
MWGIFVRKLIVNADDFGLHELINAGIVESHIAGCVTSTTIMAGGSAFKHAIRLAKQYPKLGVGVHLTLVGASPVARADVHTLLTQDGTFFPTYREFVQKYILGLISKEHIEYELRCQMQKVAGSGILITHVDSHQHLHVLPGMAEIVGRIAQDFKVHKVRIPAEPLCFLGPGKFSLQRLCARTVLSGCSRLAEHYYARQGFCYPRHFYGMLAGGAMSQAVIQHLIENLPDGVSEIMVHPGKNTKALDQVFAWGYHWQEEMEVLKSKEVLDSIRKGSIQLINYRELCDEETTDCPA